MQHKSEILQFSQSKPSKHIFKSSKSLEFCPGKSLLSNKNDFPKARYINQKHFTMRSKRVDILP